MVVTLYKTERIYTQVLPEKASGRFYLRDEADGLSRELARIEGDGGQWRLRTNTAVCAVLVNNALYGEVALEPGRFYVLRFANGGDDAKLYAEALDQGRGTFRRYVVQDGAPLTIGRDENCGVVLRNPYVSGAHVRLTRQGAGWLLEDLGSSNGTYVNDYRCAQAQLSPGDTVCIVGVKLVLGNGFFAINDPGGVTEVRDRRAQPLAMPRPEEGRVPNPPAERELFYRAPRFRQTLEPKKLTVDGPPAPERIERTPAALIAGPAVTMAMTSLVMAFVAVSNYLSGSANLLSTIPALIMAVSMMCATILWPTLTRRYEKKRKQQAERLRAEKYRAYLDRLRDEIAGIQLEQQAVLNSSYPGPEQWSRCVRERSPELWERAPDQPDFLSLRVGTGRLPLRLELDGQKDRFTMEDDYLMDDMRRLASVPHELEGVPVTWSLLEHPVTGVLGGAEELQAFLRLLALQIAAAHSYDEVKLVLLAGEEETWAEARWLPHTWDGDLRMVANDPAARKYLSASLEKVLSDRTLAEPGKKEEQVALPCYVVLVMGREAQTAFGVMEQLCAAGGAAGFYLVAAAEQRKDLPRECTKVIDLWEKRVVNADGSAGEQSAFQCDWMAAEEYAAVCREMANIRLDIQGQYELPGSVSFLDMYGVDNVEHLNARNRWRQNDPVHSLQAPVGIGTDGALFSIDVHEKVHGPHGLVAGMTGSGKSESVISMILSMAVNYAPDEVAFILIDYKGGGLTGAFENPDTGVRLPHLAGTITNLDGAEINRSLVSIESELKRRQAAFKRAQQATDSGTIDIYKYQQLYRDGQVEEPIPHLLIISDEFAELKSQQPEFMDQLISTARIGRSLGVHLILATQKPAGVVDDQIWSNSRFRLCLKVQDKTDSMDMIKRPDAAEIKETGRFYLQVGFNEYFAKGQSAWSGAPYAPGESAVGQQAGVSVIDSLGRTVSEARPGGGRSRSKTTQVVAVVKYLDAIARADGIQAHPLWLPPLRKRIDLHELREQYGFARPAEGLAAAVGEYDDPARQSQGLLTLDLNEGNALLFGSMGSGKTTFLSTVLCSLLEDYTAEELNIYLVDLGTEALRLFAQAPQVGGVLVAGETDRMENLFKMLLAEMDRRRRTFADYGGDYAAYRAGGGESVPRILVVIHNYAVFSEQFEALEDPVLKLSRDGEKYGIHFIITAMTSTGVRYRLMQNFKQTFTLQFADPVEYSILLGTARIAPGKAPGRGLVKLDGVHEYQTALPPEGGGSEAIRTLCAGLAKGTHTRARPVPVLPDVVDLEYVSRDLTGLDHIPVGVSRKEITVQCMDCEGALIYLMLAQESAALTGTARALAAGVACLEGVSVTVFDADDLFDGVEEQGYTCVRSGFDAKVMELSAEMVRRNNTYKASLRESEPAPEFEDRVYLFTGIAKLLSMLSEEGRNHLETLLEKAERHYRIRFILCDTDKEVANVALTPWFKRGVDQSRGVWIGSGIAEQSVLRLNRITNALYEELGHDFGYLLQRGKPTLIKLLKEEGGDEL